MSHQLGRQTRVSTRLACRSTLATALLGPRVSPAAAAFRRVLAAGRAIPAFSKSEPPNLESPPVQKSKAPAGRMGPSTFPLNSRGRLKTLRLDVPVGRRRHIQLNPPWETVHTGGRLSAPAGQNVNKTAVEFGQLSNTRIVAFAAVQGHLAGRARPSQYGYSTMPPKVFRRHPTTPGDLCTSLTQSAV